MELNQVDLFYYYIGLITISDLKKDTGGYSVIQKCIATMI